MDSKLLKEILEELVILKITNRDLQRKIEEYEGKMKELTGERDQYKRCIETYATGFLNIDVDKIIKDTPPMEVKEEINKINEEVKEEKKVVVVEKVVNRKRNEYMKNYMREKRQKHKEKYLTANNTNNTNN
jgi:hypothetical protein